MPVVLAPRLTALLLPFSVMDANAVEPPTILLKETVPDPLVVVRP